MKTKGLAVTNGYLHGTEARLCQGYGVVPVQLWNRLRHHLDLAGLQEAFAADREAAVNARDGAAAEIELFQRWAHRVGFTPPAGHYEGQQLWPWTRGWTEQDVDSYLEASHDRA